MEGQRDKDMGRWGSDGKESEQQLSHVRVRCGEAMLCEIKISTPEQMVEKGNNRITLFKNQIDTEKKDADAWM